MSVIHPPKLGHARRVSRARRRSQPLRLVAPRVISPRPREEEAQLVEDLVALIESGLVVPILDGDAVRYAAADQS
ncbi:MAG: hypothetical protein ACLP01_25785 [Solirubrobacteraceae bacterium]